jgi:aminodeoxyfutalosine deaminase
MASTVYQARWILPITLPPIENGRLVVQDGRIAAVEKVGVPDPSATDLGDCVVLPGFVNAHTHLLLTDCHGRVPWRGSFVRWIEDLTSLFPDEIQDTRLEPALQQGQRQSLAAGVTTVGDVGFGPDVLGAWRRAPLNTLGFLEVLGMGQRRHEGHARSVRVAAAACERFTRQDHRIASEEERPEVCLGISPHAPYSTDAPVYREAIALARRAGLPICTHLAETREELQFLSDGTGDFADFLSARGLLDDSFEIPGCSPVEYMRRLGLLDVQPLLVHCNYVCDDELDLIAGARASVAYCPRSHAFFHHEPHRWREMLTRGINVCIGTDSLASNDTLSVLDELRFLRRLDPSIPGTQLIHMGTLAGARALGLADEIGSLEPGKRADLAVVLIGRGQTDSPLEAVLAGTDPPSATFVCGHRVAEEPA